MISVIIPVYNVEPYVRRCLDSVVNQTYKDLEILVIDDGSTDDSGKICDKYKRDERVKVFHTENRGLSAARNLGLDNASGEWIGFVDSDDWIEPDMYEVLLKRAEETGADIAECGFYIDYPSKYSTCTVNTEAVSSKDALNALINESLRTEVWNKIFRSNLFLNIRFPDGRNFEEISTTYKLLSNALVSGISNISYHYVQRRSSISKMHDTKTLKDYWIAHKQRYEDLKGIVDETLLLRFCASAIGRVWVWYIENEDNPELMEEISKFSREHFTLFGHIEWPIYLRISIFSARFNNQFSYFVAYILNQIFRFFKPRIYS